MAWRKNVHEEEKVIIIGTFSLQNPKIPKYKHVHLFPENMPTKTKKKFKKTLKIIFIKFGGSIITHKNLIETAKTGHLAMLCQHLVQHLKANIADLKHTRVVLGIGAGSFGHATATEWKTETNPKKKKNLQEETMYQLRCLVEMVQEFLFLYGAESDYLMNTEQLFLDPVNIITGGIKNEKIYSTEEKFWNILQIYTEKYENIELKTLLLTDQNGVLDEDKKTVIKQLKKDQLFGKITSKNTDATGNMADKIKWARKIVDFGSVTIANGQTSTDLQHWFEKKEVGTKVL